MDQIELWKEYAITLQNENSAKNRQREALYAQIDLLTAENHKISKENYEKENEAKDQKDYIYALEDRFVYSDKALYQMNLQKRKLQYAMQELLALRDSWQSRISDLQLRIQDIRGTSRSKDIEIDKLMSENLKLKREVQLLRQRKRQNNKFQQLFNKCEMIQAFALEKQRQAGQLQAQNKYLFSKVEELENIIKMYDEGLLNSHSDRDLQKSQTTMISQQSIMGSFNRGNKPFRKYTNEEISIRERSASRNQGKSPLKLLSLSGYSQNSDHSPEIVRQKVSFSKYEKPNFFNNLRGNLQ